MRRTDRVRRPSLLSVGALKEEEQPRHSDRVASWPGSETKEFIDQNKRESEGQQLKGMQPSTPDFRIWQKRHPNFMTPNVRKVRQDGNYFVELSEGEGFDHKPMYGVSVVHWTGSRFETQGHKYSDRNKPFYKREDAERYFKTVI
jgi:hypothetical protein